MLLFAVVKIEHSGRLRKTFTDPEAFFLIGQNVLFLTETLLNSLIIHLRIKVGYFRLDNFKMSELQLPAFPVQHTD